MKRRIAAAFVHSPTCDALVELDAIEELIEVERDREDGLTIAITPKCDHDWTGPEVAVEQGSSVSCAKCGALAIDEDMKS